MNQQNKYPLPSHWGTPDVVEDTIDADGVHLHRAGLSVTSPEGAELLGSAAEVHSEPIARAWFELLERVSAHEAIADQTRATYEVSTSRGEPLGRLDREKVFPESPSNQSWRYARSNGVAIHVGWENACERAHWELVERDRVIRSWHGELLPQLLTREPAAILTRTSSYDWRAYSFAEKTTLSPDVAVVGVFGFPTSDDVPFVLGLAGRRTIDDAYHAAASEALQLMAFLWGEPPPDEASSMAPGPMQHLDVYQVKRAHERVRGWLDGGHLAFAENATPAESTVLANDFDADVGFVDLTPPWMAGDLRVAKAISRKAVPFVFGESPLSKHLPSALRLHPIP